VADGRTGTVFIEDFDTGLVTTFGAVLKTITLDGEDVQDYAVQIPGVTGPDQYDGLIPVIFQEPEDVYQESFLPHIAISRSAITPAMQRWHPVGKAYQVAAKVAQQVVAQDGSVGPSLNELKGYALPFDITYDIHMRARLRGQANLMLKYMGRYIWAYGSIYFTDNEGDERGYVAYLDSIDNLDEVVEFSDRTIGFTMSIRVEGELDFSDPIVVPTMRAAGISLAPRSEEPEILGG
jgi:hypothetical protein